MSSPTAFEMSDDEEDQEESMNGVPLAVETALPAALVMGSEAESSELAAELKLLGQHDVSVAAAPQLLSPAAPPSAAQNGA